MGLFSSKKQSSNQGFASRLADLALVGGTLIALAQRRGWISGKAANRLGSSSQNSALSLPQLIIVGSAALRLVRWFRSGRKN